MPFKSEKQRKWMHANEPEMAKDWEKKESVNEGGPLEIGKLRDAILMFKKKIEKQGMVKNARDEEHLEKLIKIYNKMGGKKIKEDRTLGIKTKDVYDYLLYIRKYKPEYFKNVMKNKHIRKIYDKKGEMFEEGFGGELKGKDKEKFEKARKENAEQLGYKLTGVSDIREANYWGGAKHMVQLPKSKMFFNPTNQNFWLMGPDGGPDWDDEPISPGDSDYKRTLQRLSSADKSAVKKSMRGKKIDIKRTKSRIKSKNESFTNEKKGDFLSSLFPKVKVDKAIKIAKKMKGNMTGAVKAIEKFFPGMSKHNDVQDALRKYNESVNEGMTKYNIRLTKTPGWYGIWDKNGKQKFEGDKKYIMKHLKKLKTRMGSFQLKSLVDLATDKKGKNISFDVAESVNEALFSKDQIEIMRKSYGTLSRINPFSPTYKKFIKFLEKLPKDQLKQLANAKIKFVSILAKNRLKGESVNENSEKAVKDMIKRGIVKKGQSEKVRVKAIKIWIDKYSDEYKKGAYPDPWKRRLKLGHGGKVQDWWGDTMHIASKMLKESVNEANMKDIEKVLKKRQAKKIDGMYMDMTTANAIMTVYKALNTTNKKKFAKLPLKKMVTVTWKLVK